MNRTVRMRMHGKASVVFAEDVADKQLKQYLCSAGPSYCARCESKCAFGQKYLKLKEEGSLEEPRFASATERANYAKKLMDEGIAEAEAAEKAGYKSVRVMKDMIYQTDKKARKHADQGTPENKLEGKQMAEEQHKAQDITSDPDTDACASADQSGTITKSGRMIFVPAPLKVDGIRGEFGRYNLLNGGNDIQILMLRDIPRADFRSVADEILLVDALFNI